MSLHEKRLGAFLFAAALAFAVIGLMLALSVLRTSSRKWSAMPAGLRWYPFKSRRISAQRLS